MGREHRIISALAPTDVPVAPVVGLETDEAVNGAPFYVMDFVDGIVVLTPGWPRPSRSTSAPPSADRWPPPSPRSTPSTRRRGPRRAGPARGLPRPAAQAVERPVRAGRPAQVPEVTTAYERLLTGIPEQGAAAIVHGDYRLDNCMVDASGEVIAVLDWELCTLGDPSPTSGC
ncbi:MAG: phosphotransferase family protein [Acidimicrobiales bacterium]